MSRPSRETTWLEVATVLAKRSTCLRRAVGCVLVDVRGHVLATGFNGVASGEPHCHELASHVRPLVPDPGDERDGTWVPCALTRKDVLPHACPGAFAASGTDLDGCHAVHAEQNALLQCRDVQAIDTCYVTTAPCVTCTKLLLSTGCRHVVYLADYPQAAAAQELWLRREAARRLASDRTFTGIYDRPDRTYEPQWTWRRTDLPRSGPDA